ncbi:LysR family transcriptional regulator [Gordonia hankookensis]|uniref:LysR family transcriptional regulator n=1 Tax=Gordonia hankookensis TaxID=589403 RepID=A0ABR7WBV9_9ACTN|nr:LysR family transcriptional regulator [Gordonia hankookensis]MBD1320290.1 LysR family transcriptional regulator [Gordonia hankookensis]
MDEWVTELSPQLRALVELAVHEGHVTGAAAALGIPQSSMSRRIHALEKALHVPLVVRDGRTLRLTPSAITLADSVRAPLREIEAALTQITDAADPDHGTVRFGFPLTMGSGPVPGLLVDFSRRHPDIHLQLKQAHGAELIDDLRHGRLDLAITIPPPADLPFRVLATQEICAILPEGHTLAGHPSVLLGELSDERFVANPPSYHLRQVTEEWCMAAGFVPDIGIEITQFSTIRDFVRRGLGVALLPRIAGRLRGIVEKPIADGEHTRQIALTSATRSQSPATQRLNAFIVARRFQ